MSDAVNQQNPTDTLWRLRDIGKEYTVPGDKVAVFTKLSLVIAKGESLAIMGASGSGKSSLLHILGALDRASWGEASFAGRDLNRLSQVQAATMRNRDVGFVFQFHHLLPEFSAVENAAMPAFVAGMNRGRALAMAREALDLVDMGHRAEHRVTTLSGGERQRVAIARAILMKPVALLADEPTGNLDERNGDLVGELLVRLNRELSMTLVIVTHNPALAARMGRQLELFGGDLHDRTPAPFHAPGH